MTKRTVRTLPAALAALLLLGACGSGDATTTATHDHGAATSTTTTTTSSAPTTSTAGIAVGEDAAAARSRDIMFAQMMIPHHEQALVLADLALAGHGASAKVQDLATRIKTAQGPEIARMKGWLTTWGAPLDMGHDMPMQGIVSDADMKTLAASKGADFDRLWLTHMIAHHEGAVTMAQDVLETTQDAEVKTLANAVVAAQRAEIAEMKGIKG